ncbi:flagellar hook assembly protein FlgD [Salinispira pacifica]|nr:flagellar hook assembly protein FlgD [Salinispira pacifica]
MMEGISSTAVDTASLRSLNGIDRSRVQLGSEADGNQLSFENLLSSGEQARVEEQVLNVNRGIQIDGRQIKQSMDKDDYLTLLIAQLKNQDPTKPMEDREFIAQMAQFSSLEQMTNMSKGFETLASQLSAGQASSMLGKEVDVVLDGNVISGKVQEITRGEYPQVRVDGTYYDLSDVSRIREGSAAAAASAYAAQSKQD